MRRSKLVGLFVVLVLTAGLWSTADATPSATVIRVVPGTDLGPVNTDLIGFNWREGGEVVGPLGPRLGRMWSADLSKITPARGVYDWSAPDRHVEKIRATGATPLIVLIGRPSWSPEAGSAGYEEAIGAVVERYGVHHVPEGAEPAWFESGNEPEFPPTAHGQLLHELPSDTMAQARAVAAVEHRTGTRVRWGGPGSLFADPPVVEAFATAAQLAGRAPDYLSWHSYTNQPFLGPDGAEFDDPAYAPAYATIARRNPVATPAIIGISADVMRAVAARHVAPNGEAPEVVITEWHLSSGGLDHRHDTHEGAAHTLGGLVELQDHGVAAGAFFAAADRHCPQPADEPDPLCGDWGTATADGTRKPVWFAFDWWQRLSGTRTAVEGASPADGLWAIASHRGAVVRLVVASFSVSNPRDRTLLVDLGGEVSRLTVRHLDASVTDEPPRAVRVDAGEPIVLPANSAVLVEGVVTPNRGR